MANVVPELAAEMERELRASGDVALADQVAALRMVRSCGCGDDFCASFHTVSVSKTQSAKPRYGVPLSNHHLIVSVREGEIVEVEVLFRDDLRPKIRGVFGDEADWRLRQEQAGS